MGSARWVAELVSTGIKVERIRPGLVRVELEGGSEIVYVAGTPDDRWAFWKGQVYRRTAEPSPARRFDPHTSPQSLTAPMPATVVRILVQPGSQVRKGDAVLVLEAMKMELPLRAPGPATVAAVHCREGELVQPDTVLVEFA